MKKKIIFFILPLLLLGVVYECSARSDKDKRYMLLKKNNDACVSTLKRMYVMLDKYSRSNKGFLPDKSNFDGLKPLIRYGATAVDFSCKASREKKVKKNSDLSEKSNSYIYFGGINLHRAMKDMPNLILMCDKPNARHMNVLLVNGEVESIKRKELKAETVEDIIVYINQKYKYPANIYELLLKKARSMDKDLGYRKK